MAVLLNVLSPLLAEGATPSEIEPQESSISLPAEEGQERIPLLCGHTYTAADFSYIKAGSLSVSDDGLTLTFDQLNIDYEHERVILFQSERVKGADEITIQLEGDNQLAIHDKRYSSHAFRFFVNRLTVTGNGSLNIDGCNDNFELLGGTSSFYPYELVIDNTNVNCLWGEAANFCIIKVIHSRFEGLWLGNYVDDLIMEDCTFRLPVHGWFDKDADYAYQKIKDENGFPAKHFIIAPDDDPNIPNGIEFLGTPLLCGHTYTADDFSDIKAGSLSVSDDGLTLTLDQLDIDYNKPENEGIIFYASDMPKRFSMVLKGNNKLQTSDYNDVIYADHIDQLTITGDGALTTKGNSYQNINMHGSNPDGSGGGELVLDNTRLTCLGLNQDKQGCAVSGSRNIVVRNSRFEGNNVRGVGQLTLEGSYFKLPRDAQFNPETGNLKDPYGNTITHFVISTGFDTSKTPSKIIFMGDTLLCGRTYTSDDYSAIKAGSMTIAEGGQTMTFDQLQIECDEYKYELFDVENEHLTIVLKGDNTVSTTGWDVMYFRKNLFGYDYLFEKEIENNNYTLTITGDGTLTTHSQMCDFRLYGAVNVLIDHTTLHCEGDIAFGYITNNWTQVFDHLTVNHSTFTGNQFQSIASLDLIDCVFVEPEDLNFYTDKYGIHLIHSDDEKKVTHFEIVPADGDPGYRVAPSSFGTVVVPTGTVQPVAIHVRQQGEKPVGSVAYMLSVNGIEQAEQTVALPDSITDLSAPFSFTVPFPASETTGTAEAVLTVTKVNGHDNTWPRKSTEGTILTIDSVPQRRVLLEEFTSTQDGGCPRGIVARNMLNELYGDSIITIAIHMDDPMFNDNIIWTTNSYPKARINRGPLMDPYYGQTHDKPFGINTAVEEEIQRYPIAGIETSAVWIDQSQFTLKVETKTRFLIDVETEDYGLSFMLIEDGMTGESSLWKQKNSYAGTTTNDPNLEPWETQPNYISGMEYDDVAIDEWGVHEVKGVNHGLDIIRESNIEAGVTNITSYIAYPPYALVQDVSKLSVVAILIDRKTGRIVNTAKSIIKPHDWSNVTEMASDKDIPSTIYSISGQRVSTAALLRKGVYVRNGKKWIVK